MKLIRKKTLQRVILILLAAAVIVLGLIALNYVTKPEPEDIAQQTEMNRDPYAEDDDIARVFFRGKWYKQKQNCRTFLLIGVDELGGQKDYGGNINHAQSDFLMLLVADDENRTYSGLHLNRDTMTDIPVIGVMGDRAGTTVAQLALAHTYGSGLNDSCEYTVEAVSNLLFGVGIDHYAAISIDSIGILNDQVGGVTVTVPVDMTEYDAAMAEGAEVKLNAKQAEYFVRSRYGLENSTNLDRMKRQRTYLNAWKQTALQKAEQDAEFTLNLAVSLADYLVSDMTANQLSDFANTLIEYEDLGVEETSGESVLGETYMEFYVDEEKLQEQVIDLFYEEDLSIDAD